MASRPTVPSAILVALTHEAQAAMGKGEMRITDFPFKVGRESRSGRFQKFVQEVERRLNSLPALNDPVRYAATVHENVTPVGAPTATTRAMVSAAVRAAGAEGIVEELPRGYDTLLGKWFDAGVELSGGEWQRVALARALLRATPILLLDEPTSAMDSWAEADWFDRFRQAAAGRTTIIITHRFTTAMQADIIHVMEHGRSVESGSHEELLARGGRYADSWRRQTGNRSAGLALFL